MFFKGSLVISGPPCVNDPFLIVSHSLNTQFGHVTYKKLNVTIYTAWIISLTYVAMYFTVDDGDR